MARLFQCVSTYFLDGMMSRREQAAEIHVSLAPSVIHAASHWSIVMRLNQTFASCSALYLAFGLLFRKLTCDLLSAPSSSSMIAETEAA
jgi:hypothetical protein